jgi:hypothetical protein
MPLSSREYGARTQREIGYLTMYRYPEYFIDYLQLYVDLKSMKGTRWEFTWQKLSDTFLCPGFRQHISEDNIKLYFEATFFKGVTWAKCVSEVRLHMNAYIAMLKRTTLQQEFSITISRIDLAQNSPYLLRTDNHRLVYSKNQYFAKHMVKGTFSGYTIGQGGSEFVQFKAYDKRLEPNRQHDLLRFGTVQFTRKEWMIGHRFLKQNYIHLATYDDLITHYALSPEPLSSYVAKSKNIIFTGEILHLPPNDADFVDYDKETFRHRVKMVKTVITNHFTIEDITEVETWLKLHLLKKLLSKKQ